MDTLEISQSPATSSDEPEATSPVASHSPAPWRIRRDVGGGGIHPSIPGLVYLRIESANVNVSVAGSLAITGYIREVDAALLAAAPDLLEALRAVLAYEQEDEDPAVWADSEVSAVELRERWESERSAAWDRARAAIAKAIQLP